MKSGRRTCTFICALVGAALFLFGPPLFVSTATAQTYVPGGPVSGSWSAVGSPYHVLNGISVEEGDTLSIGPGVTVEFQGQYGLSVYGTLDAVGTEADSVRFTTTGSWTGVAFRPSAGFGSMSYCVLQGPANQLLTLESSPEISHCSLSGAKIGVYVLTASGSTTLAHCRISGNDPYGGVECNDDTSLTMIDCLVSGNRNGGIGAGGVTSEYGALTLQDCVFEGNRGDHTAYGFGGAVSSYQGTVEIIDCTFIGNYSGYTFAEVGGGGAIGLRFTTATISGCTLHRNSSARNGASVYVGLSSSATLDRCTIDRNESGYGLASICVSQSSSADITNCIISRHEFWSTSAIDNYGSLSVEHTDFFDNVSNITHTVPMGFADIVQVNANGDSCDIHYNLFLDPIYVGSGTGGFHDLHLRAESPCIDAGAPSYPPDPDGTTVDMGSYWYDQRRPEIALSTSLLNFGTVAVGEVAKLPLMVRNLGAADLVVGSVICEPLCFTTDFEPADGLVAPGDSLLLMVTFEPGDVDSFVGTLTVDSNDEPGVSELIGVGAPGTGVPEGATTLALLGPWPNPTRRNARLQLELPEAAHVRLELFDASGRLVALILDGRRAAGTQLVNVDLSGLAAGTYFYRCEAGSERLSGKISLLK